MQKIILPALVLAGLTLSLVACDDTMEYWQRTGAPSTAYLTGDQAQTLLEKDLSQCACGTDQLRDIVTDDDQAEAYQQSTINGAPAGDPREFRACMQARGWQKVDPYFAPGQVDERTEHYQATPGKPLCQM
jgi:hypothetical protein